MRAASSVQDLLADPIGAYLAGHSFVAWFQARLAGAFASRRLHPDDEPIIRELLVSPVLPPGYDLLLDSSELDVFDERAYELLDVFFASGGVQLTARLRRFALVRPGGLTGAGLAGMLYDKVKPIVDAGVFTTRGEAMAWLGYAADAPEVAEIEALLGVVYAAPPIVRRLRELLRQDAGMTLGKAARALGTSERSLQRELARSRTSFRQELTHAQVRTAESLLTGTDDKIETIANRLGFAAAPAFITMFARAVGETPDQFRQRHRARGRGAKS